MCLTFFHLLTPACPCKYIQICHISPLLKPCFGNWNWSLSSLSSLQSKGVIKLKCSMSRLYWAQQTLKAVQSKGPIKFTSHPWQIREQEGHAHQQVFMTIHKGSWGSLLMGGTRWLQWLLCKHKFSRWCLLQKGDFLCGCLATVSEMM